MDIFNIAPHRQGKMVQRKSTSFWWIHLSICNVASDGLEHHNSRLKFSWYYMKQPMFFHCDQGLKYEAAARNLSSQNLSYNLGMVHVQRHISENFCYSFWDSASARRFLRLRCMDEGGRSRRDLLQRRWAEEIEYGWKRVVEATLYWIHLNNTAYPLDDWAHHLDLTEQKWSIVLCGSQKHEEQTPFCNIFHTGNSHLWSGNPRTN